MDHKSFLKSVPPDMRAALTAPSDARGLAHLAGHVALIVGLATYVATAAPLWPLALLPLGIALAFLFTLQHECTHKTPFATPWLNDLLGHATGLILIQPFLWFRAFHMAHHRFTNDPEKDPELAAPKPETRAAFAWHLIGIGYWASKLKTLVENATNPARAPYLTARQRPGIKREARLMAAAYALAAASLFVSPLLLWIWLIPLALGFPFLRLYLLAEHGRCPQVANMFDNTRTTFTSRTIRFLAWNMPFHAEHHCWPTVPFHNLPRLHALTAPHLRQTANGYSAFTRDYTRAL